MKLDLPSIKVLKVLKVLKVCLKRKYALRFYPTLFETAKRSTSAILTHLFRIAESHTCQLSLKPCIKIRRGLCSIAYQ